VIAHEVEAANTAVTAGDALFQTHENLEHLAMMEAVWALSQRQWLRLQKAPMTALWAGIAASTGLPVRPSAASGMVLIVYLV